MDTVFITLLLVGLTTGLVCVLIGVYLLAKRVGRGAVEMELPGFGKIKTTETGLALMFLGVFLFAYSGSAYNRTKKGEELRSQVDTLMTTTARNLWKEFHAVTDGRQPPISLNEFSRVNLLIGFLQQIDLTNGHALYYAGEVKRWEGLREAAHQDFYKYLEVQQTLPEKDKGGGTGSEICYERPRGYCRQRSGWIHHLLANDFYLQGVSKNDPAQKLFWFRKALEQAKAAMRDFPPNGFVQLVPTAVLEPQLQKEIETLERLSPKTP